MKNLLTTVFIVALVCSNIFAQQLQKPAMEGFHPILKKHIPRAAGNHTPNLPSTVLLNFEGIPDNNQVLDYYNGGGGTDYGVSFSGNWVALVEYAVGGYGNIANLPSPVTALYTGSSGEYMNVPSGFSTNFSFYYTGAYFTCNVDIYDGLNGTGNHLAGLELTPNIPADCSGLNHYYCLWAPITIPFTGTAKSVVFSGQVAYYAFDDFSFQTGGAETAVPTLGQWGLICLAFTLLTLGTVFIIRRWA